MLGRRSLNVDLIPLDPDLERNFRKTHRAPIEMGDNERNARQEENQEYQDAREENMEQIRAYNVDFTTSLWELFAPVVTSSCSCIVLPPTNATYFDLKSHIIQLLSSFYGLDHENPYAHVKKFRNICATTKFQNSYGESVHLRFFLFLFTIEPRHGWIPTCPSLLHLGKACWVNSTISFSQCLE